MANEEDFAKVYFDEGESGWVERLPNGNVRIANIPMSGRFNIDDEVKVDMRALIKDPFIPLPGEIVKRTFPVRAAIWYAEESDFKDIVRLAKERGAKVEGMVGPRKGKSGFAVIAALSKSDIEDVVEQLELVQPKGWEVETL